MNLEIERRWLLKKIPKEIDIVFGGYESIDIKQWYIAKEPVLRLRSENDNRFFICLKTDNGNFTHGNGKWKMLICQNETETELTKKEFENLKKVVTTHSILKTRYIIPLHEYNNETQIEKREPYGLKKDLEKLRVFDSGEQKGLIAEMDIFHENNQGLIIIEVEFESEESALKFIPPDCFGKTEITGKRKYANINLAKNLK